MKSKSDILDIIKQIKFLDRKFVLHDKGDGWLLQVRYMEADIDTGKIEEQCARKWYVSPHMTETEIVETAYAAICRSMMHIIGEHFTYRGKRVYSPHFEIEARIEMCIRKAYDARPTNGVVTVDEPGLGFDAGPYPHPKEDCKAVY